MGATEEIAKAIDRLTEVTGEHLRPWATRRQAKADACKIETVTQAEIAALDLKQRAAMERQIVDIHFQANTEAIREKAKGVILDRGKRNLLPENTGEGESDPDWFTKFNEWARESSDVDIQALWAKVLAGEVIQPGRFSLRLLQLIRVLRKSDAAKFQRLARYVWVAESGDHFVLRPSGNWDCLRDIHHEDRRFYHELRALGLLRHVVWEHFATQTDKPRRCSYHGEWMSFTWKGGSLSFHIIDLTSLGAELYQVADPEPDHDYLRDLLSPIESGQAKGWAFERRINPPAAQSTAAWDHEDKVPRFVSGEDF